MKYIIKYSILYIIFTTSAIWAHTLDKDSIVTIKTEQDLKNLLENNVGPSAISFHMEKCGWCMKMHPIFESLANNDLFDHITFYSVNGPAVKAYIHTQNILHEIVTGYPTILFMNQGKVVHKQIGGTSHDIMVGKLTKHLPKSSTGLTQKNSKKNKNTKPARSRKAIVTSAAANKIATRPTAV